MATGCGNRLHLVAPAATTTTRQILLDAFKDQMAGSIRRLKASKPIAVKTRKVVAAMLTLNKFAPDDVVAE